VVVDHGVHVGGTDPWPVVLAALACPTRSCSGIGLALLSGEELVAAAVGDVAELGDVDVDQRPRMVVLVAT
jgi:hypothetical protein